jgi:hypothetical protein
MLSNMEVAMTAIAKSLFTRIPATKTEPDSFGTIVTFCAVGLFVSVLALCLGFNLSPSSLLALALA